MPVSLSTLSVALFIHLAVAPSKAGYCGQHGGLPKQRISIDAEVERADKAVQKLAVAADMPMRAIGLVTAEIVFVDAHDRPLDEVMESLARVNWFGLRPFPKLPRGGMKDATVDVRLQYQIKLRCGLSPGHYLIGVFKEPMRPPLSKAVPIDQLPQAIQVKLRGEIKYLERNGRQ